MDAMKDASGGASLDGARRASTSISVPRQSTSTTTPTTTATALTASSNSNVAHSLPSRSSPPPSYLLDDDPFANRTPMTVGTRHRSNSSVGSTSSCIPRSQRPPPIHPELVPGLSLPAMPVGLQAPKSRLQESLQAGAHESDKVRRVRSQDGQNEAKGKKEESKRKRAKTFFVTMSAPVSPSKTLFTSKDPVPPLPTNSETISLPSSPKLPSMFGAPPPTTQAFAMTRIQPRPAHQRPAFAARPSLPSLDTLAKTGIVLSKKVKKGRVGAGLPFEPWDNLPEDDQQWYTAPYNPATPTTAVPPKTPMKSEAISDIDRTPTSTPVSAAPASPTKSSSSSTRSSAISTRSLLATPAPQPLLPGQIVALGPLVEDLEIDTASSLTSSRPLQAPSTFKADAATLPPEPSSSNSNLSNNFIESHALAAPVALLPSVPEASILKSLEAGNDMFRYSDTDSDRISMEAPDDENGYFNGDLLDAYGISCTPEPDPEFHNSQPCWTNELDTRSDDLEASAAKERELRWSVDTHDTNAESQPHSPIYSSSNSYAGSASDLSSWPSYPPSYSFGYGWSSSDRDSMTDVSRDLSLSRSISSTSISTCSIGDGIESNVNLGHFRSRSANTSDWSQGADISQSLYDDHLLLRSSTLIATFDSGNNSILHSPDSEWTFLTQRTHPSYLPDVLVGPALQKLPTDDSAADHQTQQIQEQADSEHESRLSIISALQNPDNSEDAQETHRNQQNSHAVAHDVFDESPATADAPFPTSSSDSAPPEFVSFLQRDQESRFSFLEAWVEPTFSSTTSSDQRSWSDAAGSISAETVLSQTSSPTANPPEHLHLETEPEALHEMTGIDKRSREKMTHSGEHFGAPSAVSSDFGSTSPRGNKSGEEEERRRRRIMLPQMRRGQSFQSFSRVGDDKAILYRGYQKSADASSARSNSRSISRTPSVPTSSSNPQHFPSAMVPSLTSDSEGQNSASSDDDIPLAQRIPGALTAQQSIRKQVNEEREARRVARQRRQRERQVTLRPAVAGVDSASTMFSTSQEAAFHTAASFSNPGVGNALMGTSPIRQPSGSVHHRHPNMPLVPHGDFGQAFKPEDLARKLQNVKMMSETPNTPPPPAPRFQPSQVPLNNLSRSVSGNSRPSLDYSRSVTAASPVPRLKPKRSFHAPDVEHYQARDAVSPQDHVPPRKRSISMGRGDRERTSRRGDEDPVPPLPSTTLPGRTNLDDHRDRGRRALVKAHADSRVTSPFDERLQHNIHDTPIGGVETSRHRIFIHSLQLSHMVDIRTDTTAGDLISSLETEGVFDGWTGLGEWMIWEVAQDFGMERPVRSYELLSDIQASWMKDKTVNYFLLRKSLLSSRLDRSAIPSSAPGRSGWVEWEARRGKWSKRWLHLKENSIYISKKEGRDEVLLCSLSNFDAYYVTRSHRAPKPFSFTIKSTDKLSFFENTADYMHTFACNEKDGEAWVEKILVARSYVLQQERSALFHPKSLNNATNTGAALSRSGTKKTIVTKPHQPLVNLSLGDIFEPGSLLSKQSSQTST